MSAPTITACHCVDVAIQSYDNQVSMKCPHIDRLDGWVCIDTCIATEIGWLWHQGVRTINSCCGHGSERAWVIVDHNAGHDVLMDGLGYEYGIAPSGLRAYWLRSGTDGRTTNEGEIQ